MINKIGETAGAVWKYLREHPRAQASEVKKALKLNESLLWMAIGWLAREGKLVISKGGKAVEFSLAPHER